MFSYEFITPSDPITFKAVDDRVACAAALLTGSGKAGIHRFEGGKQIDVPTMFLFHPDPLPEITKYLGQSLDEFLDSHIDQVADALESFCYGTIESREEFDDACAAITDPEKLSAFRSKHENNNRTSMSAWVSHAWKLSKRLRAKKTSVTK